MAVKKAVTKKAAKKGKTAEYRNKRGQGVNPDSAYGKRLLRRTEENLTPPMKNRRDVFITEYLYDFNAAQAWRRMKAIVDPEDTKPYTNVQAAEQGYMLTREPYVALKIRECLEAQEESKMLSRQRVLGMAIREAEREGLGAKHAARVSSIGLLMRALKMVDAPGSGGGRGGVGGHNGPRGGVMVVPDVPSVDDWEAMSAQAQAQLKDEVRK